MVPTTRLPQIRIIPSQSTKNLADALEYLQNLYQPPVRGSRRRRSAGISSNREPRVHLDPFERNYTLRWLTALISHLETQDNSDWDDSEVESLVQLAASILALCSGTAGAGTFHRDFVFTSRCIPSCSVTVRVKDIPLDNQDYASVGAQTWGGACVLAESIVDEPWKFGLGHASGSLRVLELGAGTGLVSLTVGKLLSTTHPPALPDTPSILIATDYYSPVLDNLALNITTNFPPPAQQSISITSHYLDWSQFSSTYASEGAQPPPKPFDEPFDIILGADIVYELDHATWIKSCLSILLKKPGVKNNPGAFHLVIPLRSTHVKESHTVELVFPFAEASSRQEELCILSKEVIICETEEESGEGVDYIYYKIGWSYA